MEKAEKRYVQILNRSFKSDLDLFLFENIFLEKTADKISKDDYLIFSRSKELEEAYSSTWQILYEDSINYNNIILKIKDVDDFYLEWYKDKKKLDEYKKIFVSKRFINLPDFLSFYDNKSIEKSCCYCGITETKIDAFINQHKIHTKRLLMRGRTLEIDRINPNGKYDKDNMVLCCYWCNNAKSDEFTFEEFKPIGELIKKIWEKRS